MATSGAGAVISGPLLAQLRDALLDAFPTWKALEMMVELQLDERLGNVVSPGALREVVYDLLTWARAQGRLGELVAAARRENGGNARLAEAAA
ncbi:MAG TPA: effector-associated domain EAD1-containing protein, partial [Kofleriaceae bacterium]|nr:effector-associated domain EAD1-containing protein [Kofleriaceae bacterium]